MRQAAMAISVSKELDMDNYHITKDATYWSLKKEGAALPSKTAGTLAQAFLSNQTASLKIHREDGTFEEERTYPRSADPSRSVG
jgi:hypothetical protein